MTQPNTRPDLLGIEEVAAMLGVQPGTVRKWRVRGDRMRHPLPDPDWMISGVPIWLADTIRRWADERGS